MSAEQYPSSAKTVCITDHSGRTLKYDHSGRSLWAFTFKRPIGVRKLSVLSDLEAGGEAILVSLNLPPAVSNHLMYMGFVPDARVRMLRRAPAGDPTVYAIDGMVVALRHETAKSIQVKPVAQDAIHAVEKTRMQLVNARSKPEQKEILVAEQVEAQEAVGADVGAHVGARG
jgi:ferrous iron transport protein A